MSVPRFRIALLLAAVVAVAALVGVLLTGQRSPVGVHATAATTAPSPAPSPAGGPGAGRFFGRGGPGCGALVPGAAPAAAVPFDGAYGFGFGCGGTGTVTAISGGTLTVRTLTGSITVTTSSSTRYVKEGRSIGLSDVRVNDVISVRGQRQSGSGAQPSTTITARQITVVMPAFVGRVVSVVGPTIFIVTANGQMAYVYTTSSTAYAMAGAASSLGAVQPGRFVYAVGTQNDLTHLTADVVRITSASPGHGRRMPPHPSPTASGTAT